MGPNGYSRRFERAVPQVRCFDPEADMAGSGAGGSGRQCRGGHHDWRERAKRAAEAVTALGRRTALIDLEKAASIDTAVEKVSKALGGLDLPINNAGICAVARSAEARLGGSIPHVGTSGTSPRTA